MYLRLTDRCNMRCAHCCVAATRRGKDMTLETFRAALACAEQHGEGIALGGGEPTIHPRFWEFLGLAIGSSVEWVWLATNGSQTETAIALARMARKNLIGCALSLDDYHDPIDRRVVEAFTKGKRDKAGYSGDRVPDGREIRDVTGKEIISGRQRTGRRECPCEELYVRPNGDIHICGCLRSPKIGTVWGGFEVPRNQDGDPITCCRGLHKGAA